jgi:hypothetical protein
VACLLIHAYSICSTTATPVITNVFCSSINLSKPPDESMWSFELCQPHTLVVMLQAAELWLLEGLSEDAVNCFLKMEIEKLNLTKPCNTMKHQLLTARQSLTPLVSNMSSHWMVPSPPVAQHCSRSSKANNTHPYTPVPMSSYHPLTDWIRNKIWLPGFEDL